MVRSAALVAGWFRAGEFVAGPEHGMLAVDGWTNMIICLGTTPAKQRTMAFDGVTLDAVNRATRVVDAASGKVTNVTRVLHALGEPAVATGFLGGEAGAFMLRALDAAGVRHDFVTVAPETRTCVTVVDERGGTATELVEESKPVEPEAWDRLRAKLDALLRDARLLVMTGTLTPGAPQDFYADCVRRATRAGVRCIVDAVGEPLRLALPERPFIAKPNRAELARTLGEEIRDDATLREAMRRLIDAGPLWAVVTLGADGVVASDGTRFWRVRVPPVRAINPIGSGDSFAAGLAVETARGRILPEALRLAVACGAANAMTAVAGDVRVPDVRDVFDQVRVESWD